MKRILVAWLIFVMGLMLSVAQDNTPLNIIERCIISPTEPPDDWTFDGTIITFRQGDGVHGFRADTPSRYYIAFDSQTEYARFGSLSLDGKWFVSFVGGSEAGGFYTSNVYYFINQIKVVSTYSTRETYFVPLESYQYQYEEDFRTVMWLNNSSFAAFQDLGMYIKTGWKLVDPFAGTVEEFTEKQEDDLEARYRNIGYPPYSSGVEAIRPITDESSLVYLKGLDFGKAGNLHVTDPVSGQIYNTCIETSRPFAVSPTGEQVAVSIGGNDGFVYILDIADWKAYRLDLAANSVIAWVAD